MTMNALVNGLVALAIVSSVLLPRPALAQQFNSGSTGVLGAFPPATSASPAGAVPSGTTGITVDLSNGVVTFTPTLNLASKRIVRRGSLPTKLRSFWPGSVS